MPAKTPQQVKMAAFKEKMRLQKAKQAAKKAAKAAAAAAPVQIDENRYAQAEELARKAREASGAEVDPLEAFMAVNNKVTRKEIKEAEAKEAEEMKMRAAGIVPECDKEPEPDPKDRSKHCYICKKFGHTKAQCPESTCFECGEVGHQKGDCPEYAKRLVQTRIDEKKRKIRQQKEKKKAKKKEEWEAHLRASAGVYGFAELYKVLELPPRKLADESTIRAAYKKMALKWHPDKHPNNQEEALEKFNEIKAAYDLLVEGIRTGGVGMGGAVFKMGDLECQPGKP